MVAVTPSGAPVTLTASGPCTPRRSMERDTFAEAPALIVSGATVASCIPAGAVAAGCISGAAGDPGADGAAGAAGVAAALDAAEPLWAGPPQPPSKSAAKPEATMSAIAPFNEVCRRNTTFTPNIKAANEKFEKSRLNERHYSHPRMAPASRAISALRFHLC